MATHVYRFEQFLKIPVLLSDSNWEQWSIFVQTGLEAIEKVHYLTNDAPNDVAKLKLWNTEDSAIRMILWNSMEPEILSVVHTFKTTKKMWDHLQATYSGKASMANTYAVSQSYARCEQGELSLTEYFASFKKASDKMRELFPYCLDQITHDQLWDQLDTLMFLGGTFSKYSSARPILLGQSIVPTLANTYHLLRDMFPSEDNVTSAVESSSSAFGVTPSQGKRPRPSFGQGGKNFDGPTRQPSVSSSKIQCRYCKEWGHMKWDCPIRPKTNFTHPPSRATTAILNQEQEAKDTNSDEAKLVLMSQLGIDNDDDWGV